jgi:hypothetical protein
MPQLPEPRDGLGGDVVVGVEGRQERSGEGGPLGLDAGNDRGGVLGVVGQGCVHRFPNAVKSGGRVS